MKSINVNLLQINIAPNPSSQNFSIQTLGLSQCELSIVDVLGREVYHSMLEENSGGHTFGDAFSSGTYIARIISDNNVYVVRIVKE